MRRREPIIAPVFHLGGLCQVPLHFIQHTIHLGDPLHDASEEFHCLPELKKEWISGFSDDVQRPCDTNHQTSLQNQHFPPLQKWMRLGDYFHFRKLHFQGLSLSVSGRLKTDIVRLKKKTHLWPRYVRFILLNFLGPSWAVDSCHPFLPFLVGG